MTGQPDFLETDRGRISRVVVTLISESPEVVEAEDLGAGLSTAQVAAAIAAVEEAYGSELQRPYEGRWLAPEEACEVIFRFDPPLDAASEGNDPLEGIQAVIENALSYEVWPDEEELEDDNEEEADEPEYEVPLDVLVQALPGDPAQDGVFRRKRILLADMDSTILAGETLDEMADRLGLGERISGITARAMRGELDFEAALRERVGLLARLPSEVIAETLAELEYSAGAAELVATMRSWGARCVLVSGGFKPFTSAVREELGFHEDLANDLVLDEASGTFTGEVREPIVDQSTKEKTLLRLCGEEGVPVSAAVAVGDGANDLGMILRASEAGGLGVAYYAKPQVEEAARFNIRHGDLTALLYMQGIAKTEFVV